MSKEQSEQQVSKYLRFSVLTMMNLVGDMEQLMDSGDKGGKPKTQNESGGKKKFSKADLSKEKSSKSIKQPGKAKKQKTEEEKKEE